MTSPGPSSGAGSCVRPERIEFWQGQVARLHDRFVYTRAGGRRGGSSGWRPDAR